MSTNKRNSVRCPVLAERQTAIIRVRGRDYEAVLVDESARGIGIVVAENVPLKERQEILIYAEGNWSAALVVRCEAVEGQLRLGLLRTKDLVKPRGSSTALVVGLIFAAAVVGGIFFYRGKLGLEELGLENLIPARAGSATSSGPR